MTTRLSVIDRLILFLVVVVLGGIAAVLIGTYFNAPWAEQAYSPVPQTLKNLGSDQPYVITCVVLLAVALFIGIPLLIANLRTHRFSRAELSDETVSAASAPLAASADQLDGGVGVNIRDFANSVADDLEHAPGVEKVRRTVFFNNHQPTVDFKITADSSAVKRGLFAALENSRNSLEAALPKHRLDIRYALSLRKNERQDRELN